MIVTCIQGLRFLCSPWDHIDRLICAYSYFSSVTTVEKLEKHVLPLIGVVKTETNKFPMDYIGYIDIEGRGD